VLVYDPTLWHSHGSLCDVWQAPVPAPKNWLFKAI
jgi:hypothetical protein